MLILYEFFVNWEEMVIVVWVIVFVWFILINLIDGMLYFIGFLNIGLK